MIKVDDEQQFFYESLDRILSSYSSSTSNSDDDEEGGICPNSLHNFHSLSSNYDVWTSTPSSVEERRSRLLLAMGLADDGDMRRSDHSDLQNLHNRCGNYRDGADLVSLSRSSHRSSGPSQHAVEDEPNLSFCPSATSIPSAEEAADRTSSNASLSSRSASPSSATMANNFSRGDGALAVSVVWPASDRPLSGEGDVLVENQGFTIKNLDNGEEFVVNDGVWKSSREEVGRGKELTMEEFDLCVGISPIVQELMRRQNVEEGGRSGPELSRREVPKQKRKGGWLKSIREVANSVRGHRERKSSDERDTSSEKGGRRSSSATDDSQEMSFHGPERVRVHQYGKAFKELSALYKSQEVQGHKGSIWCIKFSLDGLYLASAGEDCDIHVWQVLESERKGELLVEKVEDANCNPSLLSNGSSEPASISSSNLDSVPDKKRRGRPYLSRKSLCLDHVSVPETIFALSEKPVRSFRGHLKDVLDISWSKSQYLLSSSMDKTVRLWHLSSQTCLKLFSHNDYVTCIQFNPIDDRYFISGSLDAKVRTWSIPDRKVVDWNDLHEMVTAVCYTPDGQGALVGSYRGSCWLYKTSENKLQHKTEINLHNKRKKSNHKKITGFQFSPGSLSEVIITSADSRVRVVDGVDLIHKFKGFRNTSSQISASPTANGRYVVCASEDSNVYLWRYRGESGQQQSRPKGIATITRSYEHFHCRDVAVAVPWPGATDSWGGVHQPNPDESATICGHSDVVPTAHHPPTPADGNDDGEGDDGGQLHDTVSGGSNSYLVDRIWATWPPEEKFERLSSTSRNYYFSSAGLAAQNRAPAWGLVIVTAGLQGEIRAFQNFGAPLRA